MINLRLTLRPLSDFGTPLAGDTLFGQLCWVLRERYGVEKLAELLSGYVDGRPFAVVSDGFPAGFLPKPALPDFATHRQVDPSKRKESRRHRWLPLADNGLPFEQWLDRALPDIHVHESVLTQNTINRLTGTTGSGPFAPRQVERIAFAGGSLIDIHVTLDDSRLDREAFRQSMADMGAMGFGRDATTGLGKFSIESDELHAWQAIPTRHFLTLAPCAPVPGQLDAPSCFYQPITRFGRHGGSAALTGTPFKRPILLLRTGALLSMRQAGPNPYHGTGIGGTKQPISTAIPQTVHQGYAPMAPLNLELPT